VARDPAYHRLLEHNGQFMYYLARAYTALRAYAQAEKCYQAMLRDLAPDVKEVDRLLVYYSIGKFYWLTRQYPQARDYLTRSLALSARVGTLPQTAGAHLLLFKVDSAQGRFPAAIAHYQQYKQLTDSVFSTTKSKQLASLQVQYDTKKKEQDIALLTKQNQVQQAGLRQRELQRNAMLGGTALLALLLGVSYNRARIKRRSTRLLEEKQQEINQKNQSLEQVLSEKEELLAEKEWMLKEIHHRVKNNLQIVSSLLATQGDYLADAPAAAAMRESQNRVQAMALIHQRLYQADNLTRVPMRDYLRDIVTNLLDSFDCHDTVRAVVDVDDSHLDVAQVTPLGLIVNEAVTNSLKYAFPAGRPGTVRVEFRQPQPGHYQLVVADDGVGLPPGFDTAQRRSLGLLMMHGLSRQLAGQLQLTSEAGVQLRLTFTAEQPEPAVP
jgi:two-component system, sensor histidine kinase PdtaS